jgi:hypothetical protein
MKTIIRFLPVLLLVFLLASCGSDSKKTDESAKQQTVSEAYSWEHIFVKDDQCAEEEIQKCTHVLLDFPVFKAPQMANANQSIIQYIADVVGYGDAENQNGIKLEDDARALIRDYQEFHQEFPESTQAWNVRLKSRFTYEKEGLYCLMLVSESYTGGAHGALNKRYMNFDAQNGRLVQLIDRISDKAAFLRIAERKFRKQKHLSQKADLKEAGYWFTNEKFTLPANIGIDDKGYLLRYNAYEIAPYAMGPTDIRVDFDELK